MLGDFLPRLAPGSRVYARDLMLVPGCDVSEHIFGRPALQGARFCAFCFRQGSDEQVFLRGRPVKEVEKILVLISMEAPFFVRWMGIPGWMEARFRSAAAREDEVKIDFR